MLNKIRVCDLLPSGVTMTAGYRPSSRSGLCNVMKVLSETHALERLHQLKCDFAARIRKDYEHRAKDCLTCETQGVCCQDVHFVNVQITRLEAVAIAGVMQDLPQRSEVLARTVRAVEKFSLADDRRTFYACPLFEKGVGCLVHERGKPLPCIMHACYENKEDLPPDELLHEQEVRVERLNRAVYQKPGVWLPLPLAIMRLGRPTSFSSSLDASPK